MNRDRSSDGSIGDASHAATKSDHNPNPAGVVRAVDVDVDGIPADWIAEHLRRRGEGGDGRLTPGGCVILLAYDATLAERERIPPILVVSSRGVFIRMPVLTGQRSV